MLQLAHIIGIFGATLYTVSYYLFLSVAINGNGWTYALLNFFAAGLVLISFNIPFDWATFAIQISFFFLCWLALARRFMIRRAISLSVQEKQVADLMFPDLPYRHSLQLIRQGYWKTETSATLAQEGKPIENLSVLLSGTAIVEKEGTQVAALTSGQMVGEVSCIENTQATAKVQLNSTAHYFEISAGKLRQFINTNADAARAFDAAVRHQLSNKLA